MHNTALVSIAMITYNGEQYLEKQLESIYKQTYKNIEVIVCDDNSSDTTLKILERYHLSHGLQYHTNKKNLGINKNFAKAFSLCKGDFIAPSDQDDIWAENKIETLVNEIGDHALIYSITSAIDEEGNPLKDFAFKKDVYIQGSNKLAFLFDNCVSGHTTMFIRELLPFMKEIPEIVYPDWWSAFVASCYSSIKFLDTPLVSYRRHSNQATHENNSSKSIFSFFKVKEQKRMAYIKEVKEQLKAFLSLSILDLQTKTYMQDLLKEFEKYDTLYYNKRLEKLLQEHENELFAMHASRVKKYTKKLSKGIWYYRLRLYL